MNQGMWEASKTGKGREQILPRAPRRECSPVNTLISAQGGPRQTPAYGTRNVLWCLRPLKFAVMCCNSTNKQTHHAVGSF